MFSRQWNIKYESYKAGTRNTPCAHRTWNVERVTKNGKRIYLAIEQFPPPPPSNSSHKRATFSLFLFFSFLFFLFFSFFFSRLPYGIRVLEDRLFSKRGIQPWSERLDDGYTMWVERERHETNDIGGTCAFERGEGVGREGWLGVLCLTLNWSVTGLRKIFGGETLSHMGRGRREGREGNVPSVINWIWQFVHPDFFPPIFPSPSFFFYNVRSRSEGSFNNREIGQKFFLPCLNQGTFKIIGKIVMKIYIFFLEI